MRDLMLILLLLTITYGSAQMEMPKKITMSSQYLSEDEDVSDLMFFQGVDFYKLRFSGDHLKGATFKLTAKEFWDGRLKEETLVTNSKALDIPEFAQIKDSVFTMKVISKLTDDQKLKMSFKFPRYGRVLEYEAVESEDYSLRNVAESSGADILLNETFNLLTYILPYEKDGAKYWCAVENSGKDIENWGKEFGIEHYLVFEMTFEK